MSLARSEIPIIWLDDIRPCRGRSRTGRRLLLDHDAPLSMLLVLSRAGDGGNFLEGSAAAGNRGHRSPGDAGAGHSPRVRNRNEVVAGS